MYCFGSKNVYNDRVVCGSLRTHHTLSKNGDSHQLQQFLRAWLTISSLTIHSSEHDPHCHLVLVAKWSRDSLRGVPINVRSAPSAPFRFGYEYTNIRFGTKSCRSEATESCPRDGERPLFSKFGILTSSTEWRSLLSSLRLTLDVQKPCRGGKAWLRTSLGAVEGFNNNRYGKGLTAGCE